MKRIQLFEFEDLTWFPSTIRSSMTNLIVVFLKIMGTTDVLASLITKANAKSSFETIIDIGSGSGGAMPEAVKSLNKQSDKAKKLLLTDLHPNYQTIERINSENDAFITYRTEPLNATELESVPKGLRTMINSFHHMPPHVAKGILKSAQNSKQPFLAYELAENTIPLVAWWVFLPISLIILFVMTWFMTPFVRPLTFKQLFFTYLIPIVPICYAWDGQASLVRTYTFDDIKKMLSDIHAEGYRWEVAPALNAKGKKSGYYIMGWVE